MQICFLCALP